MRQAHRKIKSMNGIRCTRINGVRVKIRAKSKLINVTQAVIRIRDLTKEKLSDKGLAIR